MNIRSCVQYDIKAYFDVVGVLVIIRGVEDDLRVGLGADIAGRNRLGHC